MKWPWSLLKRLEGAMPPSSPPVRLPVEPAKEREGVRLVSEADLNELCRLARQAREAEFDAAKAEAVAALPEEPEYRVIQGRDGLYRVEARELNAYPRFYGQNAHLAIARPPIVPPEVKKVSVAWDWRAFAPTFETEAQARKWLKDYLKPPTPKVVGFDRDGNEVPTTPPSA